MQSHGVPNEIRQQSIIVTEVRQGKKILCLKKNSQSMKQELTLEYKRIEVMARWQLDVLKLNLCCNDSTYLTQSDGIGTRN